MELRLSWLMEPGTCDLSLAGLHRGTRCIEFVVRQPDRAGGDIALGRPVPEVLVRVLVMAVIALERSVVDRKVIEFDTEVICGGVAVRSGDVVFADVDGVVIVPEDRAERVLDLAAEKAVNENKSRDGLLQGRLLKEVYDKYGVH